MRRHVRELGRRLAPAWLLLRLVLVRLVMVLLVYGMLRLVGMRRRVVHMSRRVDRVDLVCAVALAVLVADTADERLRLVVAAELLVSDVDEGLQIEVAIVIGVRRVLLLVRLLLVAGRVDVRAGVVQARGASVDQRAVLPASRAVVLRVGALVLGLLRAL